MQLTRSTRHLFLAFATLAVGACNATNTGPTTMSSGGTTKVNTNTQSVQKPATDPHLTHRFSFTKDAKDEVGRVDGTLKGGAKVADGKLVIDNGTKGSGDADLAYLEFGGSLLPKSGSASIAFWFSGSNQTAFQRVLDFGDREGVQGRAFIYFTPRASTSMSRASITATTTGEKTFIDATPIDDGAMHMVVIVIDDAAKKFHLYIDGKEPSPSTDLGANTLDKVRPVTNWLGRSLFDQDPGLTGSIAEFRVYDVALSPDAITAQLKAGPDALPMGK